MGIPDGGAPDGGTGTWTVDVHGRVMDLAGRVKDGTWVIVKSDSFQAMPVVDQEGNFAVADVPVPYDVWVIVEGTSPWDYLRAGTGAPVEVGVTASIGLSSPEPTLLDLTRSDPGIEHDASIRGRVAGGIGFPTPDGYGTVLAFSSPTGGALGGLDSISRETGAYLSDVQWSGSPEVSGTLHALQFQLGAQGPRGYSGYGATSVHLSAGEISSVEVPLAPVTAASVSGTYSPPPDYPGGGWSVWMSFGADRGGVAIANGEPGPFSAVTPNIPDATFWVLASASLPTWEDDWATSAAIRSNLSADATGVTLSSPPAAELNLPESGTDVSTSTRFSWTTPTRGLSILHVRPTSSGPSFYVLTSGSSASIPDLAGGGPMLPVMSGYGWWVVCVGPFPGIDAAAPGIRDLLNGLNFEGGPPTSPVDGYITDSVHRTFRTSR